MQLRGYHLFLVDVSMEAEDGDVTLFGTKVSDMQEDVVVGDDEIVGTLKYLDSGDLVTTWGAGNFMALTFINNDFSKYSSVKVGMDPSQSSGLVEIINDPDKNGVFKVTNKDTQVFKIVYTDAETGETNTQTFDLSGLEVLNS